MISMEFLATTVVPVMALVFVGAIGLAHLFYSVRKRFPVRVNCWFCNTNTRVHYESSNSWFCPSCTQYNGFTKDGDYNREIPAQYQCRLNPQSNITDDDKISYSAPYNGLCFGCNRNQELKIHQLASFEPEVEENYDDEVDEYKRELEQAYKLCSRCERVVKRTLNDVKRNILGSKLAQIGTKGLKVFDSHMQANEKQNFFRRRNTIANICLGVITILLLMKIGQRIPQVDLSKKRLETMLSPEASQTILIAISYLVAIKDTLLAQWNGIIEEPVVADSINQLKCAKSFLSQHWLSKKMDILETVTEVLRESPTDTMVQKHALPNLALIGLAATLLAMKLHVGSLKPLVLIFCSCIELLLKADYVQATLGDKLPYEVVEMLLAVISLITALSCIGKTAPKIQHSDSVNSSFHKIYSRQGNDADCSDNIDDNSSILQDGSICSRKELVSENPVANDLSAKSMDTTKSISPSVLNASSVRPFLDSSFSSQHQLSSPWSRFGGSVVSVNQLNASFHEQPNRSFSRTSLVLPEASLSKAPSVRSVDHFTTAESVHLRHGFSTSSLNNPTVFEEDRFGNDIDRLSISGRLSIARKDHSMVNNPFATHHVDRDDSFSLRQRKVTISPPHLGTIGGESASSWIAGGYWGMSPQKNHPNNATIVDPNATFVPPYMSRTSSQSSGFESQPTRRPTPEEPVEAELDRVSLFSEPAAIFASSASSVSTFQRPEPRLNQTFHLATLPQSSPVPSHGSFFSRPSHYSTNGPRSLFGDRDLFQSQHHNSPQVPSQVFPPHHSQTAPIFGGTSNLFAHGGSGHPGGSPKAFSIVGSTRRSLLNLSRLGGLAEDTRIGE